MDDQHMKKKARIGEEGDDRISKLSDDLIHHIMSFMDTRFVVQTSVLSTRWKFVWTTLPFLIFDGYEEHYFLKKLVYSKFLNNFFKKRDHRSRILKLEINPSDGLDLRLIKKYVNYGISHNVERLSVKTRRSNCSLSMFNSNLLKELELELQMNENVVQSDHWALPNLTTLFLTDYDYYEKPKFLESCLICLPALTTLGLNQCELPEFFSLPYLTTLCLEDCSLPENVWDFPALLTLQLSNVAFPKNMSEYFRVLANLQNLAIDFGRDDRGCCVISNSQLLNLKIKAPLGISNASVWKIEVLAPKLCNFSAVGFFVITFEDSGLENVHIKFQDCTNLTKKETLWVLEHRHDMFKLMFSQLGSAKILALDLLTLQALSEISDILVHLRSPFPNLKYLKLPYGCKESDIISSVRQYLLGGSPHATIVGTLSRDDVVPQMAPAISVLAQNVVLEDPLVSPTKKLIDSLYTHGNTCSDTVAMRVPREHMVDNFVVDADKVRQIAAPIARASNDQASSSWKLDHEVNSEFVGLLDLMTKRYPETFVQLPTENKKILTVKLNMLCSSVNAFTKTYTTEVNTKLLSEYRALFTDLQRWGFNINWLMSRLNHIEQLHLSNPLLIELHAINSGIGNAESKLKDLQTLRAEKMTDSESFQTTSTSHAATACYIGDGLL